MFTLQETVVFSQIKAEITLKSAQSIAVVVVVVVVVCVCVCVSPCKDT